MKSSKFATAVFAFSGLVFLATAGHAAYQEVKPAPISIQLTDEEKKLVDGATFEMSYSTDDLTCWFFRKCLQFPNEKEIGRLFFYRPSEL